MSTDLSGSRAISAMQSPSRMASSGNSFFIAGRGRKRPLVSIAGRVMIMSGGPRLLDGLDESGGTRGQDDSLDDAKSRNENKRNPLMYGTQDIESCRIWRTQSLVV